MTSSANNAEKDTIVIVGAARTPMGGFQGALSDVSAPDLGGAAIRAAVERAGVTPEDIEDVVMALPVRRIETGAGPTGRACGGAAMVDRLHDAVEDVRFGNEGDDAGARQHPGRGA